MLAQIFKIQDDGKIHMPNVDQVRMYKDKTEHPNLIEGTDSDADDGDNVAPTHNGNVVHSYQRVCCMIVDNSFRSWHHPFSNNCSYTFLIMIVKASAIMVREIRSRE